MPWYITTDNVIELTGLTDQRSGELVSDATVTATLYGPSGQPVSGAIDVSLTAQGDGNYRGVLPATLALDEGWVYEVVYTVVNDGAKLTIKVGGLAAYFRG